MGHQIGAVDGHANQPRNATRLRVAPRPLEPSAIDRAAVRIASIRRLHSIASACAVGAIIVEEIYRGDLEAFRSRATKDDSLRKLAAHPRLESSAATLWRAVGVFALCERMPRFREPNHVGLAHLYAVLGLATEDQGRLLQLAETERWTKSELLERVAAVRPTTTDRAAKSALNRQVAQLRRVVALPLPDVDEKIASSRLAEIERLLEEVDQWTGALRERLAALQSRHDAVSR